MNGSQLTACAMQSDKGMEIRALQDLAKGIVRKQSSLSRKVGSPFPIPRHPDGHPQNTHKREVTSMGP